MKRENQKFLYVFFIVIFIFVELVVRLWLGRGEQFYILNDETIVFEKEPANYRGTNNILCIGGSASEGLGLKTRQHRYSNILQKIFPEYNIFNESQAGVPLSQIIPFLYKSFKVNSFQYCIVFSGNNEYLELMNKARFGNNLVFLYKYYLPKLFSLLSHVSYSLHNLMVLFSRHYHPKNFWKILDKPGFRLYHPDSLEIRIQNLFYRLRIYELRSLIKSHPEIHFIYVIPPLNYAYAYRNLTKSFPLKKNMSFEQLRRKIAEGEFTEKNIISAYISNSIKQGLANLKNVEIVDLDTIFLQDCATVLEVEKFFLDYCHLNPKGHMVLVEVLKDIIKKK